MRLGGIGALLLASVCFGSSAIFIRLAADVPAVSLAFYRLTIAAVVVTAGAAAQGTLKFKKKYFKLVTISGLFLCFHLIFFIMSVKLTTVANATFLVNTGPIFVALLSPLLIAEKILVMEGLSAVSGVLGVFLSAAGTDMNLGVGSRTGDLLAVLAAFLVSIYTLIGRKMRQRMRNLPYISIVYSVAAVSTLAVALSIGEEMHLNYSPVQLLAILGLALVPTVTGHGLYNYALGRVKAITANLFPLLEPFLASIFAFLLFREAPTSLQFLGYAFIVLGVAGATFSRGRAR